MQLSRNTVGLMLWLSLWLAFALFIAFTGPRPILHYRDEWSAAETALNGMVTAVPILIIFALVVTRKRESFKALALSAAVIWASVGAYVLAV
jgi:hypothetical protein